MLPRQQPPHGRGVTVLARRFQPGLQPIGVGRPLDACPAPSGVVPFRVSIQDEIAEDNAISLVEQWPPKPCERWELVLARNAFEMVAQTQIVGLTFDQFLDR